MLLCSWDFQAIKKKKKSCDFPGGLAVSNMPCNGRERGLDPWLGTKIPQAAGPLSLHLNY